MAYTAVERSDNARVRKFAPCANLTNLKEAIVSKKENITNSERTGKKDNVSDTVNFAPIERGLHRQSSFNWSERREHTRHWSERRGVHGIGAKRQCEGAQVCAVRKPDELEGSPSEQKRKYHE